MHSQLDLSIFTTPITTFPLFPAILFFIFRNLTSFRKFPHTHTADSRRSFVKFFFLSFNEIVDLFLLSNWMFLVILWLVICIFLMWIITNTANIMIQ